MNSQLRLTLTRAAIWFLSLAMFLKGSHCYLSFAIAVVCALMALCVEVSDKVSDNK